MKHHLKDYFGIKPLAIDPRAIELMFDLQEIAENEIIGEVAIVSICGALEHHKSRIFDSYDAIVERLEEAFCDDSVSAVVMCIDSPGGDAAGSTEAHRQIQKLKKEYKKPLFSYSNEAMYSAAYSIGSAADEIWVPETGGVGSVGVICPLLDKTEANKKAGLNIKLLTTGARKADTHADRPLTDDVVDAMQARIDYLGNVFFKCVSKARDMSVKEVVDLEAGVFMGQEAVDSGLANGVAGWYKFLQYVSEKIGTPIGADENDTVSSSKEQSIMTLAEMKKAKEEAAKKLAAAKSSAERTKLFAAYEITVQALSDAQAKTKYVKKTEERLTKDEDEDDDDDDSDTDESEDEESSDEDESEETEAKDDEDCEEDESEDSSKKMKKKAKSEASISNLSLKSAQRLYSAACELTGKKDVSEICGAMEGMSPRIKKMPKVEERLAKIEQSSKKQHVRSMLDKAISERRITPAQAKGLEPQGMKDSKWLKGYLSAQPAQVRSMEEQYIPVIDASIDLGSQGLSGDQQKILQQAAQSAGMSVEDYAKEIAKHSKNNGVVAAPKY